MSAGVSRQRAWQIANPERAAAQAAVGAAIRDGRLVRPSTCSLCPAPKPQAHHADYTRPLEVEWLCPACHAARHVAIRSADPSRVAELAATQQALDAAEAAVEQCRAARDEQLRADLAAGLRQRDAMEATGLSRARVDQIRRGTR